MISSQVNCQLTQSCRKKYPHMIPIKIGAQQGIHCSTNKFLISQNTSGAELQRKIQSQVKNSQITSLYFFIIDKNKQRMLQNNVTLKQLYKLYQNQEGYLVIKIYTQNTF